MRLRLALKLGCDLTQELPAAHAQWHQEGPLLLAKLQPQGLVALLALGAEADSGGAALLSGAFLGGALGGAEDASACRSAACWASTAEAHAAALAGAAKGVDAVGATPLSAAPDLIVTSCSATD